MVCIWEIKWCCDNGCGDAVIKYDGYKCDCCERICDEKNELRVKRLGEWLIGIEQDMCFDCFSAWYDGERDPIKIREKVLASPGPVPAF